MNVLYFYLFLLAHPYLAMWWKSFENADRKAWEALVPGYNYYVAFKISCNKPFWSLLLIFPGVHLVMWSVVNTSYIRRFGYYSLVDTIQGIFFPYILLAKIAQSNDKMIPETNWANSKEVGDREWGDHLVLFLCLPVIGHAIALGIAAVTRPKPGKKTRVKEWGDSLLFALVAASVIRTYVFEPFQIPTGSMEKTLVVGDFLFVNKLAYGPKVPVTPLSYPLVHNTVPWVNIKSYTSLETSNYTRLPGFTSIQNNDVVVFNFPSGDTAIYDPRMPTGLMGHDYHGKVIKEAIRMWREENTAYHQIKLQIKDSVMNAMNGAFMDREHEAQLDREVEQAAQERIWSVNGQNFIENLEEWKSKARKLLSEDKQAYDESYGMMIDHYGTIYRPVDKRENYIKRCVGIPGDVIRIDSSRLYVNNKEVKPFENQNLKYKVRNLLIPGPKVMDEKYGLEKDRPDYYPSSNIYVNSPAQNDQVYTMFLTNEQLRKLKRSNPNATFTLDVDPQYTDTDSLVPTAKQLVDNLGFFPKDLYVNNTVSDYTEFTVPKKGVTVELTEEMIPWYRRIITAYEGHKLEEKKDGFYIDEKKVTTYTFEMNYYWMMGDNRYNSADSRMWGFVPEDHIVGKASMVWFSKSPYKGIRWERLFNIIE